MIYINDSLKLRTDLSINNNDNELLSIENLFVKKCNTLTTVIYRPPSGLILPFENFLKDVLNKTKNSNKMLHIAGDFNRNLLDYEKCKKVQEFLNFIYENSMIPTINKPSSETRQGTTSIGHILTVL